MNREHDKECLLYKITNMSKLELNIYFKNLGDRILENRYRYYVLDKPVLTDWVYDGLEYWYSELASIIKVKPKICDMVGFDYDFVGAKQAAQRVDDEDDYHSSWLKEMEPVWERLGKPDVFNT